MNFSYSHRIIQIVLKDKLKDVLEAYASFHDLQIDAAANELLKQMLQNIAFDYLSPDDYEVDYEVTINKFIRDLEREGLVRSPEMSDEELAKLLNISQDQLILLVESIRCGEE